MANTINMDPITGWLKDELDSGVRTIHIWDGSHAIPEPRQIMASEALFDLARTYGRPIYTIEDINTRNTAEMFGTFTNDQRARLLQNAAADGRIVSYGAISEYVQQNDAKVLMPDPRRPLFATITKEELAMHSRLIEALAKTPITNFSLGKSAFFQTLTPDERELLNRAETKINGLAIPDGTQSTAQIDRILTENIHEGLAPLNNEIPAVNIVIYGYQHYADGLANRLPGTSLAVICKPGDFRAEYLSNPTYRELPDAVYYTDPSIPEAQRFVKLDTPEARREFLGFSPEEYRLFELAHPFRTSGEVAQIRPVSDLAAAPTTASVGTTTQR